MRIIAEEVDYYDCVQGTDQDKSLLYIRKPETQTIPRGSYSFPHLYARPPGNINVEHFIIGFCGSIFPVIEFHLRSSTTNELCFSLAEVDAFMEKNLRSKELKIYRGEAPRRLMGWRWWTDRKSYAKFFEECKQAKDKFASLFEEKRCPVFVAERGNWGDGKITYNALLRRYDFMRVFDPYMAYQEILMFMNNLAVPQKPMPVIPDELKAETHGFDKWSFRKPPG